MTRRDDVDRLARMLEGEQTAAAEAVAEERQLASLATLLREAQPEVPPMRAEFRSELRAQLVEAAREQQPAVPLLTRLRDRAQRWKYSTGVAGATGIASVALAGGGVAGAAEFAQPGDLLYGTKLALEDVRLALTSDEVARGMRALSYAQDRLAEAETAAAAGDDPGAATALSGATERTQEGERLIAESGMAAPLLDLADSLAFTEARVEALLPLLGPEATEQADLLLLAVDAARATIGGLGVPLPPDLPAAPSRPPVEADPVPDSGGPAGPSGTTSTPAPTVTTPAVPVEPGDVPLPGDVLPDDVLPDDVLPDDVLPDDVLPDEVPVPANPVPANPVPGDVLPDAPAPDSPVLDAVPDPSDATSGLPAPLPDAGEVLDSVSPALPPPPPPAPLPPPPAPVPDTGSVDQAIEGISGAASDAVGTVLDGVGGDAGTGGVGGILGGD